MFCTTRFATLAAWIFTLVGGLHLHLDSLDTQQIQDYTFDDFVRDFQRSYKRGTPEWVAREATFKQNIQKIIEQRAHATSWTVGITKFVDYHDHEYNMLLGYKGRRQRDQYGSAPSNMSAFGGQDVPSELDTTKSRPRAAKVWDQGMCGSCWAAGAIATLEGVVEAKHPEFYEQIATNTPPSIGAAITDAVTDVLGFFSGAKSSSRKRSRAESVGLSIQEMVSCTPNHKNCGGQGGCTGATAELGYDMVKEHGLVASMSWPYSSGFTGLTGSCTTSAMSSQKVPKLYLEDYVVLPKNKFEPLREALYTQGHPIAIAVDATNWNFYRGGIYSDVGPGKEGDFTVNHEVTLTGYKNPPVSAQSTGVPREDALGFWRIKNSWGTMWGEGGFIRIEMKANEGEHCGMDYDTHIGLACDGDPDSAYVCGTCGILYDSIYPTGITLKW